MKTATLIKPFLINTIGKIQWKEYTTNCKNGRDGINSFTPNTSQLYKTAYHLGKYLGLTRGSEGSWYTRIIPHLKMKSFLLGFQTIYLLIMSTEIMK